MMIRPVYRPPPPPPPPPPLHRDPVFWVLALLALVVVLLVLGIDLLGSAQRLASIPRVGWLDP